MGHTIDSSSWPPKEGKGGETGIQAAAKQPFNDPILYNTPPFPFVAVT